MIGVIETTEKISKTVDMLIDFAVEDEDLGKNFENFLIQNEIEIQKQSDLNDVLIGYLLEGKMDNGKTVLNYFEEKNPNANGEVLYSLKNSFVSIFQIKKITKNAYLTQDLASTKDFTLVPLVKTTSLRGIGLFDYIKARVIEFQNNFYLLEIFDCIGSFREFDASVECVMEIIKNPKIALSNNKEKMLEIQNSIQSFHASFLECFNSDEIIISNKELDRVLDDFYKFHQGQLQKVEYKFLSDDYDYKFFEIKEFNNNFLLNALSGFSKSEEEYDVGLYSSPKYGLFVIPFLGTLKQILLNKEVENKEICIKKFLTNDKIPPCLLTKLEEEYGCFVSFINNALDKQYSSMEDVIEDYKQVYKDGLRYSAINVLYNLEIFSKVLGTKKEEETKVVGRNDLCPCGSGKKYKKCCLNKGE